MLMSWSWLVALNVYSKRWIIKPSNNFERDWKVIEIWQILFKWIWKNNILLYLSLSTVFFFSAIFRWNWTFQYSFGIVILVWYTYIHFFLFQIVTIWFYYLGICSTIGLVFTPAHPLIPFLLLGIGIDDMFVIVQCLSNVEDSDPTFKDKSIDLLVGETLKHAGVAITITSFTDFAVLIVGTITVSRIRFVKNHLPSYILPT